MLSTKNGNVAEIVFIVDGDVYDSASTYFMLSKTSRESLKYDGDYYWEYFNAYVDGQKQSRVHRPGSERAGRGTVYKL